MAPSKERDSRTVRSVIRIAGTHKPNNPNPGFGQWARYFPVARKMGYAIHVPPPSRPLPELL